MLHITSCQKLWRFGSLLTQVHRLHRHTELVIFSGRFQRGQSGTWSRSADFSREAESTNTSSPASVNMDKGADSASAKSEHVSSEELSRGKWIALNEITYKDPTGKDRKWEMVSRTTKTGDGTDAVVIIPILMRLLKFDCVLLVKQYRPPLKAYTLEFPAGLIDKGEDPFECAVRELKEETGFIGIPKHSSPGICLDPGLSNSTVNLITMEVDGDTLENVKHIQQPEESEFIEVIRIPLDGLLNALNEHAKKGVIVHSLLYTYAVACTQTAKPKKVIP